MRGLAQFWQKCVEARNLHRSVARRRRSSSRLQNVDALEQRLLLTPTALQATHRSGQTFLTWTEDITRTGEEYHVYRHTSPITTANIGSAEKLTSQWGPLDENTSVNTLTGAGAPANFVISDMGNQLAVTQGLFVWTTQPGDASRNYYYAVTQVTNGVEDQTAQLNVNSLGGPVFETVATPTPVLVSSQNGGKGRVYTQFMDYKNWNPTFQGYAYNYGVALPTSYDPGTAYPLKLVLHAYGERYQAPAQSEFGWPTIQVFVDDPGFAAGTTHTWWYGFAADWNYKTEGSTPTHGVIENFTEQRILKTVDEIIANPAFNVDTTRIHAQGHSMGGSGALSLGIRYGNVFSGTFSSEGMTNYATSPQFQADFVHLWGSQASNLLIRNRGIHSTPIQKYGIGGSAETGVWNWMNHAEQVVRLRSLDMAFLMFGHGKADTIIDWQTQGKPFIAAINQAKVGFTAETRGAWDHNWMSFAFANHTMFSNGFGDLGDYIFRGDFSFPGITNATQSGPNVPLNTGTDFYNLNIDWSVPWNNFGAAIVDTPNDWQMTLRSRDGVQTADITPRNAQQFRALPGVTYEWTNSNVGSGQQIQSGSVVATADGLVTIPGVQILTGAGNRLTLTRVASGTVFAETGVVSTVYNVWTTVSLAHTYTNPVVITGGPSYKGGDPGVIRIRRVTANSFQIMYQEWDYLDGGHTYETVPFLVIEAGTHTLSDGTQITVGTNTVNNVWRRINATLPANAVVLTTVQSTNGGAAMIPRIRSVSTTGFYSAVTEEEAADQIHYDETLGWLAIRPGDTTADGLALRAARTPDAVGDGLFTYSFGQVGTTNSPVVLASVMTYDGGDPFTLRQRTTTASTIQMFLQEEQSLDTEVVHTWEQVGILALEPGILRKPTVSGGRVAAGSLPTFIAPRAAVTPTSLFGKNSVLSASASTTDMLFSSDDDDLLWLW